MFKRIKCFIGDLLKRDWHNWEVVAMQYSEYEPNIAYSQLVCQDCGKFIYCTLEKQNETNR